MPKQLTDLMLTELSDWLDENPDRTIGNADVRDLLAEIHRLKGELRRVYVALGTHAINAL